jgi:tRNA-binding EMAP/Myf-like protein
MSTQVTNRVASQALRGQAVLVTLNQAESAELANFSEGMVCTHDQSGRTGTINRVDYYGHSFSVNPIQPDREFGIYGYLASGATVTVSTP